MKILCIGPDSGTCRHRRMALERLGHATASVDPFALIQNAGWLKSWSFHTGGLGLASLVRRSVLRRIGARNFGLIIVDGGELVAPALVADLKLHAPFILNFNLDNPFAPRDGHRWRLFHQALPHYDLFVTPRASTAEAAARAGARCVLEVQFAADEIVHDASPLDEAARRQYEADVVFAGTWMPGRGVFLAELIRRGVPLKIYGPRWHRAPEYRLLKLYLENRPLGDREYAAAIKGAKIALGLLSDGNHDLHTTRSLEIPAMGVLLCAQRTADHAAMYRESEEAVFWDDAEECSAKCLDLLADPARLSRIAAAGRTRVCANASFNEPLMAKILAATGLT